MTSLSALYRELAQNTTFSCISIKRTGSKIKMLHLLVEILHGNTALFNKANCKTALNEKQLSARLDQEMQFLFQS